MTDTPADTAVSDATWVVPLVALVPCLLVRILTSVTDGWLVVAWVSWSLAALLVLAAWGTVIRHGVRRASGWSASAVAHGMVAWQLVQLVA
ncbi:hypothetical protein OG500_04205 [Kitasatospora sp. NBC_01250]|uniref:hypothetical protein n=1 Tax=unclassified Kitasatospora TaxID=2633591 RepID=UPI002E0E0F00|nr:MULTISPECIES: hypothetical protein [unclassified Kitasatospora]WSJ65331.1 hypothetical protein OG294_04050 [Kitasatospora sp. NBC_01302]